MNCNRAERLIYLENELNDRERAQLKEHIHLCPSCAELHASYIGMVSEVNQVEDVSPVDASRLTDNIMTGIFRPDEKIERSTFPGLWTRLGLSAVSLVLILSFYMEFNQAVAIKDSIGPSSRQVTHTAGTSILKKKNERTVSILALAEARKGMNLSNNNNYEID
jgi:hypothetical protein